MSWYKGWDVHAWSSSFSGEASSDKELFGNATQEEIEQVRLEILEKYGSQKSTIVEKIIGRAGISDNDLAGVNVGKLLVKTWELVKSISDDSVFSLLSETLEDIGQTCLQGDTHRLWSFYRALKCDRDIS